MNSITTIIFDFGGVLGSDANSWTKDSEIAAKTELTIEQIDNLYFKHWDELKVGKDDLQSFFDDLVKESKKSLLIDELRDMYHRKITINEEVFSLVKNLSKKYNIFILANESFEGMRVKKEKFHLDKHFTKIFNSAELGLAKPDPTIFTTVLEQIHVLPENTLFIDDQERNVKAAEGLKIRSIHYTNFEKLIDNITFLSL